ncbi:RidA family protein [Pseudooceanicola sp. C21-150M6]|uniref:RidA family protein n=1 Tax=Pseudooceanicola sp. C21-150M6 TaxID=3434355 RepID=UPI003D7FE8DE
MKMTKILVAALMISAPVQGVHAEMMKTELNPPGADIPGISQAVIVTGGRLMYLSGHVPFAADGSMAETFEGQLDQVLANMKGTLEAAGADFSSLVRVTFFVKDYDVAQLDALREIRDRWFDTEHPPASALIGVQALFVPQALVEVDAVAVLPD